MSITDDGNIITVVGATQDLAEEAEDIIAMFLEMTEAETEKKDACDHTALEFALDVLDDAEAESDYFPCLDLISPTFLPPPCPPPATPSPSHPVPPAHIETNTAALQPVEVQPVVCSMYATSAQVLLAFKVRGVAPPPKVRYPAQRPCLVER